MAQALALSLMPLDDLEAQASEAVHVSVSMGEQPPVGRQDALALAMLDWFKGNFFTWVKLHPCLPCQPSVNLRLTCSSKQQVTCRLAQDLLESDVLGLYSSTLMHA